MRLFSHVILRGESSAENEWGDETEIKSEQGTYKLRKSVIRSDQGDSLR